MSHTPGPWQIASRYQDMNFLMVYAPGTGPSVAKVYFHDVYLVMSDSWKDDSGAANARLIAAAPAMYAELVSAEQTLRNLANGWLTGDARAIAQNQALRILALTAKAKGEVRE